MEDAGEFADPGADFVDLTMMRLQLSGQRLETARATRWLEPDEGSLLSLWWLECAVFRSQDGTTCCGCLPAGIVSMTLYVFGSIRDTVSELVLGMYTRDGKSLTAGESWFGRSAA